MGRALSRAAVGAALLLLASAGPGADAAELVMFERQGCPWCVRFNEEVAPLYGRTKEAARAPLRRVDIDRAGGADVQLRGPVRYTPTFVLAEGGREVGRITGYPGQDHFWGLLTKMLDDLSSERGGIARVP